MKYLLLILLPLFSCTQNQEKSDYPYTKEQTIDFLDNIVNHAGAGISSYTEFKKKPANEFYLTTRYPLSKQELAEYKKNGNTLINKSDQISDFATYSFKEYQLINEKKERLQFEDNGNGIYLQELGLSEHNNILFHNLGIQIKISGNYEKLSGYVILEFIMPGKQNREVKIPVNISIFDKVPE